MIFTRVEYVAGDPVRDGGLFYHKLPALTCFDAGNPLGDFTGELMPADGDIIVTKQYPSAFFGTSLAATLTAMGTDTVLLTGLTTSGCVRATCVDAMSHGFITLVVGDACGDRADGPHQANLFDMSAKYADLITTTEAADYLNSTQRE